MSVTAVHKDPERLTMEITCKFEASPERVWQLWADPRKLERWWGPPTWPATFPVHDLRPGGRVEYYMTGPEGERAGGYWLIDAADPPRSISLRDGFANPDGTDNTDMPSMRMKVTIDEVGSGVSRMVIVTKFPSIDAMNTVLAMGMEEGMVAALGQIEAVLADDSGVHG
jgi:uncharacterized protein YndB with AHSA1/START domain